MFTSFPMLHVHVLSLKCFSLGFLHHNKTNKIQFHSIHRTYDKKLKYIANMISVGEIVLYGP